MESHESETISTSKRKRSPMYCLADESGSRTGPGNVTLINYMVKANSKILRLIEGDSETFMDILGLIDEYEGVLQRHESLAANLGAKLVAPLILKSFEKLFEGPIKVIQDSQIYSESPVTWLDIVSFACTNPLDFYLVDNENHLGQKICRFWIKGGQVEISEDDFRLITSGGPERMIPIQPISDDETAELGTLTTVEARLAVLIKKADAVASKARQLNYHLKGRKSAILNRKAAIESRPIAGTEANSFSLPFSAINAHTHAPTQNSESSSSQARLLEQYLTPKRRQVSTQHQKSETSNSLKAESKSRLPHLSISHGSGIEGQTRVIMASKIEKLNRGDPIWPPCDRCRRLKFACTKNLTACQACTKKHAKCSWRDIKEDELKTGAAPTQPSAQENSSSTTGSNPSMSSSPGVSMAVGINETSGNTNDQTAEVSRQSGRRVSVS